MKQKELVKKIEEIVKKDINESEHFSEFKELQRKHIMAVRKYAIKLAKKLNANVHLVEIGALFHDVGRLKYGSENHEISGRNEAEKVLKKLRCDKEFIEKIKNIVLTHRGKSGYKPKTVEEKIVSCADAMSHFDIVPELIIAFYLKC